MPAAKTRRSLKNKFITVKNNFRSTLSSRVGPSTVSIPLTTSPTKLGNFGYITVDNTNGGQVIFYSRKSGNTLNCVLTNGRGVDGTILRSRRGGAVVQQRVVAANVSQNQGALISILRYDKDILIRGATIDPNVQSFQFSNGGYTGYDNYSIQSVIYKGTSAQYSMGAQLKRMSDKYYVTRRNASGDVKGSSMGDAFSIINRGVVGGLTDILDVSSTGDFDSLNNSQLGLRSIYGAAVTNKINVLSTSSSALTASSNAGAGLITSRYSTNVIPLVIAAKDVVFLQKNINPHRMSFQSANVNSRQSTVYGTTMDTSSTSLQSKVQLFNVRSSSIYQPYTVVSTHWDSRIDSQLIRKDDDLFMSVYDEGSSQRSSGGKLTMRRSVGSGVSGDRWRLAYNKNLLTNGRTFYNSSFINQAVQNSSIVDVLIGHYNISGDMIASMTGTFDVTSIYQSLVDRGWIYTNLNSPYLSNYRDGQVGQGNDIFRRPRLSLTAYLSRGSDRQIWSTQFISYSQSNDKFGLFNINFHRFSGDTPNTDLYSVKDLMGVTLIPVYIQGYPTSNYILDFDNKKNVRRSYSARDGNDIIKTTSINSLDDKSGFLYSITRDASQQFKSRITGSYKRLCGILVSIGFSPSLSGGWPAGFVKLTMQQIKMQQGLQRTRYSQDKRQRLISKMTYDSTRRSINIQANQNNGQNLFITSKSYKDDTSSTASINFGKFIPYRSQEDRPFRSTTRAYFWSQRGSSQYPLTYGSSLMLQGNTALPSQLYNYTKYYQQSTGLKNLGRKILLTHSIDTTLKNPDDSILLRTNNYSGTGHRGTIRLSAYGSTASNIYLKSNNELRYKNYNDTGSTSYSGRGASYFTSGTLNQINFSFSLGRTGGSNAVFGLIYDNLPIDFGKLMWIQFSYSTFYNNRRGSIIGSFDYQRDIGSSAYGLIQSYSANDKLYDTILPSSVLSDIHTEVQTKPYGLHLLFHKDGSKTQIYAGGRLFDNDTYYGMLKLRYNPLRTT